MKLAKGSCKKSSSLNGRSIKRRGKGPGIKEKISFFGTLFFQVPKFQRPLREELFFPASLSRRHSE